jgi:hypothetical protein
MPGTFAGAMDTGQGSRPAQYQIFHVVFTLPHHLNEQALEKPELIYQLLFKTAWGLIRDFGYNPKLLGAKMGMIAVLHTWGQNMSLHPTCIASSRQGASPNPINGKPPEQKANTCSP